MNARHAHCSLEDLLCALLNDMSLQNMVFLMSLLGLHVPGPVPTYIECLLGQHCRLNHNNLYWKRQTLAYS